MMIPCVKITDHEDEKGKVNWQAYRVAQRENGELCTKCGSYILFGAGHPNACGQCRSFETESDEVLHDSLIRCPHCGHLDNTEELEPGDEVGVACGHCDESYEVQVRIHFSYMSPPLSRKRSKECR